MWMYEHSCTPTARRRSRRSVQSFNSAKEEEDNGDNGEAREVAAVTATSDDGIKFSEVAAPPEIGDARAATEEVA